MWVILGTAVFLIGVFPKAAGAVWGYYGFVCFVVFMGGMDVLPGWLTGLSPTNYIPRLPQEELSVLPLAVLTGIALTLMTAGLIGYRRRDMANS
jgi:ABC-2 type transport system permease protein